MVKKVQEIAVLIEFITSSGLALFFHLVLHHGEAALVIFGTGTLLSLATYLLREEIGQAKKILVETYEQAHEITFAMASLKDPDCQAKAQEIIAGAKRTLGLLQQGYISLDEAEFYMKGAKYLDDCQHHVKVVDPLTTDWESKGSLINYYQANLRAIKRGVNITRIFILNRDDLTSTPTQRVLLNQLRDGVEARVAFREELPSPTDLNGRDTASSFDFAIYDGMVAIEVYNQPGKHFGRKTHEPLLVGNYQRLFGLVEHVSHALEESSEGVVLAVKAFSQPFGSE